MSQRHSEYDRLSDDKYYTPAWVTEALLPHLRLRPPAVVFEPAAGNNAIVDVLRAAGFAVLGSDLTLGTDFLAVKHFRAAAIVTNPPYGLAKEFIIHAIELMRPQRGLVAMLLRTDYDHAATRRNMFNHPFAKRIVLTKRIRWIENSTGSPSFNHAWMIWDWRHDGPPTIGYAP